MNWKSEAVDRLRRYDLMKAAVENIPEEIHRLAIEAKSIKAMRTDKLAVKSGTADHSEMLLNNLVHQEELKQSLENAKQWVKTTDAALSSLLPEEKLILYRLFMTNEKRSVERLCQELGCEQSSIYRKREAALHRFTIALYGFEETQI